MRHNIFVIAVLVLLGACSKPETPEQSVIGEPLHRALERAESVQGTLDARAAEMRDRLEAMEAGNE